MSVPKIQPDVLQDAPEDDARAPRPLTRRDNIIATLKVLAGMGLVGGALWIAELWMVAE